MKGMNILWKDVESVCVVIYYVIYIVGSGKILRYGYKWYRIEYNLYLLRVKFCYSLL